MSLYFSDSFSLSHLHVSLQVQQVISVPGDESRALMGEVHSPKAGLPRPHEGLLDRVEVCPHKVIVDGDVLKLGCVAIWPIYVLVAACADDQVWVNGALGLVQCIDKCQLVSCTHLHHITAD